MSALRRALWMLVFSRVCAQAQAATCSDANGTDSGGDGCEYYQTHPHHCGCCDTSTFSASGCCACQGSSASGNSAWWTNVFLAWPRKATTLHLYNKGIDADFPTDVAVRWPHLTEIGLSSNRLSGSLPKQLGSLSNLTYLDLYDNSLSGTLPVELCQLSKLKHLDLRYNRLDGNVPPEVGNWTSMQWLYLSNNDLNGGLPWQLGSLSNLIRLDLYGNSLSGTLPVELCQLSKLEYLDLSFNRLRGSLPPEVGNWTRMQYLYLEENQLTGSLPRQLGSLFELIRLQIYRNSLSGTLPVELCQLRKLETLSLGFNQLSGSLPPEVGNWTSMGKLYLQENQFSGSLPAELGQLKGLDALSLYTNHFSGSLPAVLFQLPNLRRLDLYNNQFSGSLPAELSQLRQLETLELSFNALTGPIPAGIGQLWRLERIYLESNKLNGSLPRGLGNLTRLRHLYLDNNELSGELPKELGSLSALLNVRLQHNKITGLLPAELGNLTLLQRLTVGNNALSGSIPRELGSMSSLEGLFLHNNNLSGPLPSELGELRGLKELYLNGNQLSGPIPDSFKQLKEVEDFDASGNPLLCGGEAAFRRMVKLKRLTLRGCCFVDFPLLSQVEHINVAENRLREVPYRWRDWRSMTNLKTLHLSGNNMTAWDTSGIVPMNQFAGTTWQCGYRPSGTRVNWPELEMLDVSSNPLSLPVYDFLYSLGHLPKLGVLLARDTNLSGHLPLTYSGSLVFDMAHTGDDCSNAPEPGPGFPVLNTLDLSHNSITALLAWAPPQLVQADFSRNALVELAPNWWQGGPIDVLQRVDVRSNPELRLHVRLNASSSCPALGAQEPTAQAREWSKSQVAPRAECTGLCTMERTGLLVDAAVNETALCRCTQGQGQGSNCSLCPADTYSSLSLEAGFYRRTCLQCPAHSHLESGEGVCFADCRCEAGFHMVQTLEGRDYDVSALPCSRLPPSGRCVSCGIFKTSPEGSREETDCYCNSNGEAGGWLGLIEREGRCGCPDGFHMNFVQRSCVECKPEEDCGDWTQSLAPPRVRAGFWSLSPPSRGDGTFGNFTSHSIWRCQSKAACPGNAECGENRAGTACSLCRTGHFLTPLGSCSLCPQGPAESRRLLAGLLLASMILPLLVHFQLRKDAGHARAQGLSTTLGPFRTSVKQLLNFVQILNLVSLFRVEWPAAADSIFALTRIFYFHVAVAGSGVVCLHDQQQQTVTWELVFRWMLPVAGVLSTCCAALLLNLARPVLILLARLCARLPPKRETEFRELLEFGPLDIMRVLVFFLNLLFPSLLQNALLPLTCSPSPNGLLTMNSFPHMECSLSAAGVEGDGSYKALALVGLAQSVLLLLGFPLVLSFVLRRVDAASSSTHLLERRQRWWAFLFLAFRRHKRSWLLVAVSKDILLNLLVVFLPGLGTAQLFATALISLAYACRAFLSRPYPEVTNSLLETCTAVAVAFLCLFTAGVGFQSEPDSPDLGTYVVDGPEGSGYVQRAMALVFLQGFSFAIPLVIIFFQLLLLFPTTRRCVPRFLQPLSEEQRAKWSRQFTTSMHLHGGPLPRALAELDAVDFSFFRQAVMAAPSARSSLGTGAAAETDDDPPDLLEADDDATAALRARIADLQAHVSQRDEETAALRQEIVVLKEAVDREMDRVAFEI